MTATRVNTLTTPYTQYIDNEAGDNTWAEVVAIKGTVSVAPAASASVTGTLQAAAAATGDGTPLNVLGYATAVFSISGTFVGTVYFEGTEDGTNWSALNAAQLGSKKIAKSASAPGIYQASVSGLQQIRARVVWTSGTSVTVTAHAVPLPFNPRVIGIEADSAPDLAFNGTFTAPSTGVFSFKIPDGAQYVIITSSADITFSFYAAAGDTVTLVAPTALTASVTTDSQWGKGNKATSAGGKETRIPTGAYKVGIYCAQNTIVSFNFTGA